MELTDESHDESLPQVFIDKIATWRRVLIEKMQKACGVCEPRLGNSEVGICNDCKRKGPPSWGECNGPIEFCYRTMRYRDATELTTLVQKQAAARAIRRELSRSIRALKLMRRARYRLPEDIDDLTASRLTSILSALPTESWKRITEEIELANEASGAANRDEIP